MGRRKMNGGLPYVHSFKDRHDIERHYFRRNGKRTVLPGAYQSLEFMAAYTALLTDVPTKPTPRPPVKAGTMADLATRYFGSPKYHALSPSSRTNYKRVIEKFVQEHGHRLVRQMKFEHIESIIGQMSGTPGAAIILLKRIRTLMRYAIACKMIDHDPTANVTSYKSTEFHTWTEEEIAVFEARWPVGTRQRLAFDILLTTGQRGCDARKMVRPDKRGKITVVQQKTKAVLSITPHPALMESIEAVDQLADPGMRHAVILTTAYGMPFSTKGFGQFISAAIVASGLPAICKAHGLRKAAARRLAEVGCSVHEIMAVTGHRTLSEVERYTRAAEQEHLNESAMQKQVGNADLATRKAPSGNPIEIIEEKKVAGAP